MNYIEYFKTRPGILRLLLLVAGGLAIILTQVGLWNSEYLRAQAVFDYDPFDPTPMCEQHKGHHCPSHWLGYGSAILAGLGFLLNCLLAYCHSNSSYAGDTAGVVLFTVAGSMASGYSAQVVKFGHCGMVGDADLELTNNTDNTNECNKTDYYGLGMFIAGGVFCVLNAIASCVSLLAIYMSRRSASV